MKFSRRKIARASDDAATATVYQNKKKSLSFAYCSAYVGVKNKTRKKKQNKADDGYGAEGTIIPYLREAGEGTD